MRINLFLFSILFVFLITSCGKDDPTMEETPEETIPFFKADFNWDTDFLELAGVTIAADSVPLGIDITWENPILIDLEDTPTMDVAGIFKEDEDDDYYTLAAHSENATDTFDIFFELYGELEEKSYTFAGQDLLGGLFGGDVVIPAGTIIPYIISEKSEAALTPAIITLFGAVDFTGSTFKITSIDDTTNEVSGEFNITYVIPASDEDPEQSVMKIENGVFNKVVIQ